MQTAQLHELLFQLFINFLNLKKKARHTFLIYVLSNFFTTKVILFHSGVSRFNFYFSLTNILFSFTLKNLDN